MPTEPWESILQTFTVYHGIKDTLGAMQNDVLALQQNT